MIVKGNSIAVTQREMSSKITYQIIKYQENPEVQLAYKKCKCLEIAEMKKDY